MPILYRGGQPTSVSPGMVDDFLKMGYTRHKGGEPAPPPTPPATFVPPPGMEEEMRGVQPAADAVDLSGKLTLASLRSLPGIGTARANELRTLANQGPLTLQVLQEHVPEVDWVDLANAGRVVIPEPEPDLSQALEANMKAADIEGA